MQAEAIYKGATRPAMKLGIPLVPLVLLFGTGMLLIMWGGILVSWWLALGVVLSIAPVLLWMRWLTARDDQRFRQIFVALKLKLLAHALPGRLRCLACLTDPAARPVVALGDLPQGSHNHATGHRR